MVVGNGGGKDGGNGIGGIDHLVIAVRDLDQARDAYSRLGFLPTPRGHHTELKSANHTIMFADGDYLELMALEGEHPFTAAYADFLRVREGLASVSLKTGDARDAHARLTLDGLDPRDPIDFGRPVEGVGTARFTVTPLPPGTLPGGGAFLCEHHTRDAVWRPDYLKHDNGALGIAALVVASDDPDGTAALYARLFHAPVEAVGPVRLVKAGTAQVVVAPPSAIAWGWSADPLLQRPRPLLAGVVIRVTDYATAQQALQRSKFPVVGGNGVLRVNSTHAAGVMLAFAVSFDLTALIP